MRQAQLGKGRHRARRSVGHAAVKGHVRVDAQALDDTPQVGAAPNVVAGLVVVGNECQLALVASEQFRHAPLHSESGSAEELRTGCKYKRTFMYLLCTFRAARIGSASGVLGVPGSSRRHRVCCTGAGIFSGPAKDGCIPVNPRQRQCRSVMDGETKSASGTQIGAAVAADTGS